MADQTIRTQTIVWPASTFITTWTLGSGSEPTETPAVVIPAATSTSTGDQNVGPILSALVVFVVIVLVMWFYCRRRHSRGHRSRRSSPRRGSKHSGKGSPSSSATSDSTSQNDASVESVASEIGEEHWDHAEPMPDGAIPPMPGMPPPAAGNWPVPQQDPGMGPAPPHPPAMGFPPPGQGGHPPMMGRGGPVMLRGGLPPTIGRGGPPPGVM